MGLEDGFLAMIDRMLPYARPGGEVHQELLRLRGQVDRGVLLGPAARRFLAQRVEEMEAVECCHLTHDGACRGIARKGKCDHAPNFRGCDTYRPLAPVQGDPMRAGR